MSKTRSELPQRLNRAHNDVLVLRYNVDALLDRYLIQDESWRFDQIPVMQYFCLKSFIPHRIALTDGPGCLFVFQILYELGISETEDVRIGHLG